MIETALLAGSLVVLACGILLLAVQLRASAHDRRREQQYADEWVRRHRAAAPAASSADEDERLARWREAGYE